MPAVVRKSLDKHVGHAGPKLPFHQTPYAEGSSNVFVNGQPAVTVGNKTVCGDSAVSGSPTVFINGKAVHRIGDSTQGHGQWSPNSAATGSPNVFANG